MEGDSWASQPASTARLLPTSRWRTSTWAPWSSGASTTRSATAFATLRREAPITFFHEIEFDGFQAGAGHWALMKFDDVHFASRHPEIFSSYPNITIGDRRLRWQSTSGR